MAAGENYKNKKFELAVIATAKDDGVETEISGPITISHEQMQVFILGIAGFPLDKEELRLIKPVYLQLLKAWELPVK